MQNQNDTLIKNIYKKYLRDNNTLEIRYPAIGFFRYIFTSREDEIQKDAIRWSNTTVGLLYIASISHYIDSETNEDDSLAPTLS